MEFRAVLNRPKTCDHEIHISQTSRWVLYTAGICTTGRFVFRSKLVYDPERNPIQRMPYSFLRVHVYFPSLRTRSNTPVISCTQIRCVYSAHNPMACVCVYYIYVECEFYWHTIISLKQRLKLFDLQKLGEENAIIAVYEYKKVYLNKSVSCKM